MNPEICDLCDLKPCAFDRPNLTDAQQDALCPAVAAEIATTNGQYPKQNTLEFQAWRSEKLREIQALIDDQGPVKLIDLPALINVPRHTLQAWRVKWFGVELRYVKHNNYHARKALVFVASVNECRAIKTGEVYIGAIHDLIEQQGPLLMTEVAARVGMHYKTLQLWSGDKVIVERRGWRIFVTGIIDKGGDYAKE